MNSLIPLLSSLALHADSFATSLSAGTQKLPLKKKLLLVFSMSFFQASLPLVALLSMKLLDPWIPSLHQMDHWIAFALLHYFGIEMLLDSRKPSEKLTPLSYKKILLLALATSIDAFAFGLSAPSLKLQPLPLFLSIFLSGILLLPLGIYWGEKGQKRFNTYALATGGLILIGLGWNILLQHIYFT